MMIGLEVVGQSYVKLLLMGLHMNIWRERMHIILHCNPTGNANIRGFFSCQKRTLKFKLNWIRKKGSNKERKSRLLLHSVIIGINNKWTHLNTHTHTQTCFGCRLSGKVCSKALDHLGYLLFHKEANEVWGWVKLQGERGRETTFPLTYHSL